jgi:hypothetical protein
MKEEINLLIQLIKLAVRRTPLEKQIKVLGNPNMVFFYNVLIYCVLLANIDLEVNPEEVIFLREAGFKLGLNPDAVENVFMEKKKHKNGMIPTNRLIEIFQVYHN